MRYAIVVLPLLLLRAAAPFSLSAQTTNTPFDGRPWNVSSGNLSVSYIQASPIGAFPRPDFLEAPPSVETRKGEAEASPSRRT